MRSPVQGPQEFGLPPGARDVEGRQPESAEHGRLYVTVCVDGSPLVSGGDLVRLPRNRRPSGQVLCPGRRKPLSESRRSLAGERRALQRDEPRDEEGCDQYGSGSDQPQPESGVLPEPAVRTFLVGLGGRAFHGWGLPGGSLPGRGLPWRDEWISHVLRLAQATRSRIRWHDPTALSSAGVARGPYHVGRERPVGTQSWEVRAPGPQAPGSSGQPSCGHRRVTS